jgi:hypothetical protein
MPARTSARCADFDSRENLSSRRESTIPLVEAVCLDSRALAIFLDELSEMADEIRRLH